MGNKACQVKTLIIEPFAPTIDLTTVDTGDIPEWRHESYMKLQKELKFLDSKKSTYEQRRKDKELQKNSERK